MAAALLGEVIAPASQFRLEGGCNIFEKNETVVFWINKVHSEF